MLDRIAMVGRDEIQVAGGWEGVEAGMLNEGEPLSMQAAGSRHAGE